MFKTGLELWRSLLGAVIFYTVFPLPHDWRPSFERIARWCPLVGLVIGGILSLIFIGLNHLQTPSLIQGAIITAIWLGLTGGLHLDGAMDSADGLAVTNPNKRLEVMADSVTGAFGAMTAIVILLFKFAAISSLTTANWWLLLLIPIWGRWSQVLAIALFPYLKPQGKGAFHKQFIQPKTDLVISTLPGLITLEVLAIADEAYILQLLIVGGSCVAIAILSSTWFNHQFKGHTGDTYGATVEWTEAITLILSSILTHTYS